MSQMTTMQRSDTPVTRLGPGTTDESRPAPPRGVVREFWDSTVGKKAVMAVSGLVLVGYVIGHMLGNMKIYQGEPHYNAYALWLREIGSPAFNYEHLLWAVRVVLLVSFAAHIVAAVQLARLSRAARPIGYAMKEPLASTYASRTMRWGGVILALFVVYHVLHLTFGAVGYAPGEYVPLSVYRNVVIGFSVWYVSAFYVAAMIALGLHLYHGVWSMFQTLGTSGFAVDRFYRGVALAVTLAVVLGNISVPLAVLTGLVR
jgi:succinate dehydrogenase / fumarate reductase cytochrome b subunit